MLNHWVGMGRLTADPVLRTTSNGTNMATFTLAIDRDFDKDKKTDFVQCVAWKNTAEFVCRYFNKGQMMAACGNLQSRNWEDKSGNNRISWEIIVSSAYFAEKRNSEVKEPEKVEFKEVEDDGDLPF